MNPDSASLWVCDLRKVSWTHIYHQQTEIVVEYSLCVVTRIKWVTICKSLKKFPNRVSAAYIKPIWLG